MPFYDVEFQTTLNVTVRIEAEDIDTAQEDAWEKAQEFASTIIGNHRDVRASADFDGSGSTGAQEVQH